MDVDAMLERFFSRMQRPPVPEFEAAVAMVIALNWFAVPGLQRLLLHDNGEVRQMAKQFLLKIQEFVDPPVQFEREDRPTIQFAARVFNARGVKMLETTGDTTAALKAFNQSLTLLPNDATVLTNKASALGGLGRYAEAIDSLDRALELDPLNQQILVRRGEYLGLSGRLEEALRCFEALAAAGFTGIEEQMVRCRRLLRDRTRSRPE